VESKFYEGNQLTDDWATSTFGYGSAMKKKFPQIEDFVRIGIQNTEQVVRYKDIKIRENKIAYTEPSFFRIFDFKLLEGNRTTALNQPNTAVITQTAVKRFFNNESPIGKTLRFATGEKFIDCAVTGVMEDFPDNSHISFDYLVSYEREVKGNKTSLITLMAIALLILLSAWINCGYCKIHGTRERSWYP
jgi:putative ABC transport system permease protein